MSNRFEDFVTGITVCYKFVQKIKTTEMTEFGLKGTHAMCLYYLYRNPEGLTASALCDLCAEDKAAISRTLSDLEEKGYTTAFSSENKKKYRSLITLTKEGEELAKKVDELIEHWVSIGGEGLTDSERETFYHAIDVISKNLRTRIKERT